MNDRRAIPSVSAMLALPAIADRVTTFGRAAVADAIRATLDAARRGATDATPDPHALTSLEPLRIIDSRSPPAPPGHQRDGDPCCNTGLGRAPLARRGRSEAVARGRPAGIATSNSTWSPGRSRAADGSGSRNS